MSRRRNSTRNAVAGLLKTMLGTFFPFVVRTVIIKHLGEQFAGLSGLFTSILGVLNLAELGLSSAIIFNMYKPIADKDTRTVKALLNFYKMLYRVIGTLILVVGLCIMPFIPKLINGTWPESVNIYILYTLYLFSSSVSYFLFAEKNALLTALQRMDLVDAVFLIVQSLFYCVEIFLLIATKNIYLYVSAMIAKNVVCNIITAIVANKKFPEYIGKEKISRAHKKAIKTQVTGLLIGKIGDVCRNSLDNIIISALFGLTSVTLYGNYYYIYNAVYAFILVLSRAVTASIGDSIAKENLEHNYAIFNKTYFAFNWIITFCAICMLCLYQKFIKIWLGDEFLLPTLTMVQFCFYFYCISSNCTHNNFVDGNGLWNKLKIFYILEAVFNLILNVILGILFGLDGIVLATILTIITLNYITRTNVLFREYFKRSPKSFYLSSLKYLIVLFLVGALTYWICLFNTNEGILVLVINVLICLVVPNISMMILFKNNPYYEDLEEMLGKAITSRKRVIIKQ